MEFILIAITNYTNELDLTEEEKEQLLNLVFNVLSNELNPHASMHWNEAIFSKIEEAETEDLLVKMGLR